MRHQRTGIGVKVGAPARRAILVFGGCHRIRIEAVHFRRQRLEFGERDVAGAALRGSLLSGGGIGRAERLRAFRGNGGHRQNVGGGVQVALRMPAHQLPVFGEGHVALDHAGAHAGRRQIGFPAVFGKLQRRAAVAEGKLGLVERPGALAEFGLERPVLHLVDEVERAGSDLGLARQRNALGSGGCNQCEDPERGHRS